MYSTDKKTSKLAPGVIQEKQRLSNKYAILDVFAFIPVPVYSPGKQSSFRSLCFSILLFLAMIVYVLTSLYGFFNNNIPKSSQQQESIDAKSFTMPKIALTFIPDMGHGISMVDRTYYSVSISQGILYKGLEKTKQEELLGTDYECKPDWLPKMNFTSFLCPSKLGTLSGNLFSSDEFKFIKIDFFTCVDGKDPNVVCKSPETIRNLLEKGGRFYLFIDQDDSFYDSALNGFKALFYFPLPGVNQKFEVYLENKVLTTGPDYFHSFGSSSKEALFYNREKTYFSSLVPGQDNHLITIWLRLNEEESQQKLQPSTLVDVFGKWGALWSALLTTLGLYFWRHNRNKFYKRNPKWENFGSVTKKVSSSNDDFMIL